jgi:predicted short-subunit dehydrogenase-like oxidoreductase (DUF2520 family)
MKLLNVKASLLSIKLYFSFMKIVILGFGNVARHLVRTFLDTTAVEQIQIYNRSVVDIPMGALFTTRLSEIIQAHVYIIAIPDDAITNFSEKLPFENQLVVHTSGSVGASALSAKNRGGVFYPLQTFSKDRQVDFKTVPICIEALNSKDLSTLRELASCISEKIVEINSEERRQLHVAAVFANNFTNHLYHVSEEMLAENALDFNLLKPLILETARKIETLSPSEAQTGPAIRNDHKTMENQLELLSKERYRELYKTLTKSIQIAHGKKL